MRSIQFDFIDGMDQVSMKLQAAALPLILILVLIVILILILIRILILVTAENSRRSMQTKSTYGRGIDRCKR
jgi:threonine/homoserine/homoserine lactone efflux protein